MKKKVIKKKSAPAAKLEASKPSEDVEMPLTRGIDDADDVAEDYKIVDMSDIAAPIIEFEMPNLGEKLPEKLDETPEKTGKPLKKSGKKEEKVQLTAEQLNNELVGLRATIVTSKNQLMRKMLRQKKELEAKTEKNGAKGKEEKERKCARLVEEILGLKTIDKDSIAKFAALNSKTLNQLKIDAKTPVAERLMYKIACQECVVEKVQEIKKKYVEWNKTAAFFMQRLGQQYAGKEKKTKVTSSSEDTPEDDDVDDSEDVEDSSTPEPSDSEGIDDEESPEDVDESDDVAEEDDDDDYNQSDVEMVDSDEEEGEDAANKRRVLLLGLIGVKEDKSRPALRPKKRKIEEENDDVTAASEDVGGNQKAKKTKEDVKKEMKEILEKELKTKETAKPKKAAQKVKKTAPKKAPTPSKPEPEEPVEEDVNQKTLIMKVDLSKGGKIAKTPKSAPIKKPEVVKNEQEEDDDDDDESVSFFLPKSGVAPSSKRRPIVKAMEKLEVDEKKQQKGKKLPVNKKKPTQAPPTNSTTTNATATTINDKKKGSSKKNTAETGEMHPSWIASQLKKQQLAAAKPTGKKTTFADSDED